MFVRLLLLFTLVPLAELWLLVVLGRAVGLVPTLALVFVTGVLGAWLARSQGLAAIERARAASARGELPADALIDGVLILIAGAVLLTPGLLTDVFGFALLVPAGRRVVRREVRRRLARRARFAAGRVIVMTPGGSQAESGEGRTPGTGPTSAASTPQAGPTARGGATSGGPTGGGRLRAELLPRRDDD